MATWKCWCFCPKARGRTRPRSHVNRSRFLMWGWRRILGRSELGTRWPRLDTQSPCPGCFTGGWPRRVFRSNAGELETIERSRIRQGRLISWSDGPMSTRSGRHYRVLLGRLGFLAREAFHNPKFKALVTLYVGRIKMLFVDEATPPIELVNGMGCSVLGVLEMRTRIRRP